MNTQTFFSKTCAVLLIALTFVALSGTTAYSSSNIVVNSLNDDPRGCPQNCTLRSAITIANHGDTISFDPSLRGTILLLQPITIDKNITILGPGPDVLTIDVQRIFRPFFEILQGVTVSITGLKFDGGANIRTEITNLHYPTHGINNQGKLVVTDCTFTNMRRGAIYSERGELQITSSRFENSLQSAIQAYYSDVMISLSAFVGNRDRAISTQNSNLEVSYTTFSNNYKAALLYNVRETRGERSVRRAAIRGSVFQENNGGIYNNGSMMVEDSIFVSNRGDFLGAIVNEKELTVLRSTFFNNAVKNEKGGAIRSTQRLSTLRVFDSTFLRNSAISGGAIYSSEATIVNSTFEANSARYGSAVYSSYETTIISSTIYRNTASDGYALEGTIRLGSSIVANNDGGDVSRDVISLGNNLISQVDDDTAWFSSDLINIDAGLEETLANNGGVTQTLALLPNSPAIGMGFCSGDQTMPPITRDQRGAPRKTPCDIGAYESGVESPPTVDPTVFSLHQLEMESVTVSVDAYRGWQSTGIIVEDGMTITITVIDGQWTFWPGVSPLNSGEGVGPVCAMYANATSCEEPLPDAPKDGLIGRMGSQIFYIGRGTTVTAQRTGILELRMNDPDSGIPDNEGRLIVQISRN